MKRVAVTGIGIISPIGCSRESYFKHLIEGTSRTSIKFLEDLKGKKVKCIIAESGDFKPEEHLERSKLRRTDRSTHMAIAAITEALKDANLKITEGNAEKVGLYLGVSLGGLTFATTQANQAYSQGLNKVSPFLAVAEFPSSCLGEASIHFGIKGNSSLVSTADNSGTDAIGLACKEIKSGSLDYAIAGGTEAPIVPICYRSLKKLGLLTTNYKNPQKASKPFDKKRDGFLLSEGAAVLVLEPLSRAEKKGKKIYAEIIDYSSSFDPQYDFTRESPRPIAKQTLNDLLKKNSATPDYICAYAISEKLADKMEAKLIRETFGNNPEITVSAIKSMLGHSLGASGAFQIATACLALKNQVIPPTINFEIPDPECNSLNIPKKAQQASLKTVLVNTLGFCGTNSFVLLGKGT